MTVPAGEFAFTMIIRQDAIGYIIGARGAKVKQIEADSGCRINCRDGSECYDENGVLIARLTVRNLSASVFVEALFQGKDASGGTWQAAGSLSIEYIDCNPACDGDFDGNGAVEVADLLFVIANWGNPYTVDDLLQVIANWNCGIP